MNPGNQSGGDILLGVGVLGVEDFKPEKDGRGKEFWCCFSKPAQKEPTEAERAVMTPPPSAGKVLLRLTWEEMDLVGGVKGKMLQECLLQKDYEAVLFVDRVLAEMREEMVGALVPFLIQEMHILSFIDVVAKREVNNTANESVLFRGIWHLLLLLLLI